MNKKSIYSVVATVAGYLLAFKVARPETDLRGGIGVITLGLLVVLPLSALVLATLGVRQVRASRNADPALRYWPAVGAFVFALSFIGPVGIYAGFHWRRTSELHAKAAPPTWTQFTSPGGNFTVLLPEVATETTQTVQRADGPVTVRSVAAAAVAGPGAGYSIMIGEAPDAGEGSTTRLDRLETDFVQRSNGKLLARSTVSTGLVVGRELRVSSTDRSLRVRIFVMNGHVYHVLVVRPPSAEGSVLDDRFLESFTLRGV